ncbi:MAG: zinc-ribbon domain-containing protein [Eubacteriales bacterium]|nr:zinc-ribbon domain-containing protein [Eubacteriales bacterium]
MREWNQTNTRTPADYSYGNSQIVGWTCSSCGFTWQDSINHRTNLKNPRGCPKCGRKSAAEKLSRKNLIIGKTDIATLFPELVKEWYYENNAFLPTEVTSASDKKAHWICPQGHSYSMSVVRRTKGGQGCPFCASKRVLRRFNDLLSKRPEIAKEWDSEKNEKTPDAVTVSSSMKAWWRCSRGHSYQTSVDERTRSDGKLCK